MTGLKSGSADATAAPGLLDWIGERNWDSIEVLS